MNILVTVDRFHKDHPGGAYKIAWDLAGHFQQKGDCVAMLVMGDSHSPTCEMHEGVRIVRFPKPGGVNPFRRVSQFIQSGKTAAAQYLGDTQWDVIYSHTPIPALAAYEAFGSRARTVYTIHSPVILEQQINWRKQGWRGWIKLLFAKKMLRNLEQKVYESYENLHCLSNFTRSEIDRLYGLGEKIKVIPFWTTLEPRLRDRESARKKLGLPTDKFVIFSLRRLAYRMGIDIAIEAMAKISSDQYVYVISGDGPERCKLQEQVRKSNLEDRIRFTGRLTDEEVLAGYQAADLFLLPTRALECFGIIILESYSVGCPVLASDAGAIPELVSQVDSDLIFPSGDSRCLSGKLSGIVKKELDLPCRERLINFVQENYTQQILLPKWEAFIRGSL